MNHTYFLLRFSLFTMSNSRGQREDLIENSMLTENRYEIHEGFGSIVQEGLSVQLRKLFV